MDQGQIEPQHGLLRAVVHNWLQHRKAVIGIKSRNEMVSAIIIS
jgi:hypothetical protein